MCIACLIPGNRDASFATKKMPKTLLHSLVSIVLVDCNRQMVLTKKDTGIPSLSLARREKELENILTKSELLPQPNFVVLCLLEICAECMMGQIWSND